LTYTACGQAKITAYISNAFKLMYCVEFLFSTNCRLLFVLEVDLGL